MTTHIDGETDAVIDAVFRVATSQEAIALRIYERACAEAVSWENCEHSLPNIKANAQLAARVWMEKEGGKNE